jgi:hypothetical protein
MAGSKDVQRPDLIPELDALRERILLAREVASRLVDGLSDEQFNWRPAPDRWSICEILGHLIAVGDRLGDAIDDALERAHRAGHLSRGPFRYGWFEKWFTRTATDVARRRKVKTSKLYEPRPGRPASEVLSEFRALQASMVERMEAANGIDLARVKVRSPALRAVRMSLGMWLEMVAGHQERHFRQAEKVLDHLRGDSA